MQMTVIVALGGIILSACGSGATTAPVESSAGSGAVAGADVCFPGPPAKEPLNTEGGREDGVVGTIANETGGALWVSEARDGGNPPLLCRIDPGQRGAYASTINIFLYVAATETDRSGTRIRLVDPIWGYPDASITGFKGRDIEGTECGPDVEESMTEGKTLTVDNTDTSGYTGNVVVYRHSDNKAVAQEWTGSTDGTGDWARIDVTIKKIGGCR